MGSPSTLRHVRIFKHIPPHTSIRLDLTNKALRFLYDISPLPRPKCAYANESSNKLVVLLQTTHVFILTLSCLYSSGTESLSKCHHTRRRLGSVYNSGVWSCSVVFGDVWWCSRVWFCEVKSFIVRWCVLGLGANMFRDVKRSTRKCMNKRWSADVYTRKLVTDGSVICISEVKGKWQLVLCKFLPGHFPRKVPPQTFPTQKNPYPDISHPHICLSDNSLLTVPSPTDLRWFP